MQLLQQLVGFLQTLGLQINEVAVFESVIFFLFTIRTQNTV